MEQPALEHDDHDMPETDDHCRVDNDFGGARIDDISDDYPIIDDDPDNGSLDDQLEQFIDDIARILDYFYDGGSLDDERPDHDGRGESDPPGESDE